VKREASPSDRRTQIVKLSAAGKRSLDAMTPEHQRWIDSLFADLTATDRSRLYDLLGKLRSSVQHSLEEECDK